MAELNPDDHLPVESAGSVAGISPRTLRSWVKGGKLPAIEGPRGKLVRLGEARSADGNTGNLAGEILVDAGALAVSLAARAQLEAIRDEWLAPLIERNEALARQVDRLEAERDELRAEVERLGPRPQASPAPPGTAEPPSCQDRLQEPLDDPPQEVRGAHLHDRRINARCLRLSPSWRFSRFPCSSSESGRLP